MCGDDSVGLFCYGLSIVLLVCWICCLLFVIVDLLDGWVFGVWS